MGIIVVPLVCAVHSGGSEKFVLEVGVSRRIGGERSGPTLPARGFWPCDYIVYYILNVPWYTKSKGQFPFIGKLAYDGFLRCG